MHEPFGRHRRRAHASRARGAVVMGLVMSLSLLPSVATAFHTQTFTDGDDSRSPLDIKKVVLKQPNRDSIRFTITTWSGWQASALDLERDRYFVIAIDRDLDPNDQRPYERCVFIAYLSRLTAIATDCGRTRLAKTRAVRPTSTSVAALLSYRQLGLSGEYRWAVISYWGGTPCSGICIDSLPNRFPLILRDEQAPKVKIVGKPQGMTTNYSASNDVPLTFEVNDGADGSGLRRWWVETSSGGTSWSDWTVHATGTKAGRITRKIPIPEGTVQYYRVRAVDRQGNEGESIDEGPLYAPWDDDTLSDQFTGTPATIGSTQAYGGSYRSLGNGDGLVLTQPDAQEYVWIGSGSGTWVADVVLSVGGSEVRRTTVSGVDVKDGHRRVLYSSGAIGSNYTLTIERVSGTVPVDGMWFRA